MMHEASDIVNEDAQSAAQTMCSFIRGETPQFLMFRTILEYPTFMLQVAQVCSDGGKATVNIH